MDKKQIIFQSALKLFVENGFHGTATAKIALESGVANGTLFNYFKTKDELVLALYYTILKGKDDFILERMNSNSISKETFKSLFDANIRWSIENKLPFQYLQQFIHSPYFKMVDPSILNDDDNPLYVLIQNGIDIILIKQMPVSFIYSLFMAQIYGLHRYIISNDLGKDVQSEFIEEAFEMFWKMIEE